MRQQWDEDIVRNKMAKRVLLSAHKLDMDITMMKRVSFINYDSQVMIHFRTTKVQLCFSPI